MIASILSRYIIKQFLIVFAFAIFLLWGLIYIFEVVELLRRSANYPDLGIGLILNMSLMKLPEVGQRILPFATLFSGMFTFWRLSRTSELVVIRSAGLSPWQFLLPIFISSLVIGIIATTIINPVSSIFLKKFEEMEVTYLHKKDSLVDISESGIWLRQHEKNGYTLLHAGRFDLNTWKLHQIILFYLDNDDNLTSRVDAESATLKNGYWDIENAFVHQREAVSIFTPHHKINTNLTTKELEDSFASPRTFSFWELPKFIHTMEQTGFSAIQLKMHYQSLLAKPLFLAMMALLAGAVSLRPQRQGNNSYIIASGIMLAFLIFFAENLLHAFGISQKISIYLAAWLPVTVGLILSIWLIVHLEDG